MVFDLVSQFLNDIRQDELPVRATEFGERFSMTETELVRNRVDMAVSLAANDVMRADSAKRAADGNAVT